MSFHRQCQIASRKWIAASAALLTTAAFAVPGHATPATGFAAVQTIKGQYGDIEANAKTNIFDLKLKTKGDSDLYVVRNSIAPGGQSGWHTHPGPSLITVTAGEIMAYDGENPLCTPTRYTVGQGFVDPGGGDVHLLRNETAVAAETVAVQFIARDAVRRIDADKPTNCNF